MRGSGAVGLCYHVHDKPMERNEAIAGLGHHESELKRVGVGHLYLCGLTARGRPARIPMSICSLITRRAVWGFSLMDVKESAARILGRKGDIMTRRRLHPVLRERIEALALPVF